MTGLKTLKDLTTKNSVGGEIEINGEIICSKEKLRAEAVKWAKRAKYNIGTTERRHKIGIYTDIKDDFREIEHYKGQIKFIQNFFNLTTEDLK